MWTLLAFQRCEKKHLVAHKGAKVDTTKDPDETSEESDPEDVDPDGSRIESPEETDLIPIFDDMKSHCSSRFVSVIETRSQKRKRNGKNL